jgi:hypothetical protein
MHDTVGSLVIAVYDDEAVAAQDLEDVRHLGPDGLAVVDAGLCLRSRSGWMAWKRRPRRARRHGGLPHAGRAVHFRRGLRRRDVQEVMETLGDGFVAMVAVMKGPGVERLIPELHSDRVIVNQVTSTDIRFRQLVAEHAYVDV